MEHGALYGECPSSCLFIRRIDDVDVICPMPRHERIARNSVEDSTHHGPLSRRLLPSPRRFFRRQFDNRAKSNIHMQRIVFDKDAAPDDFSRLADTLHSAAAERKI